MLAVSSTILCISIIIDARSLTSAKAVINDAPAFGLSYFITKVKFVNHAGRDVEDPFAPYFKFLNFFMLFSTGVIAACLILSNISVLDSTKVRFVLDLCGQ